MTTHSEESTYRWRRRLLWACVVLFVAWVAMALLVMPALIRASHAGSGLEVLREWIANRPGLTLDEYLLRWRQRQWPFTIGLAGAVALFGFVSAPGFFGRFVARYGPHDLARVRIASGGVLFVNALWEDLASTAILPRGFVRPMGITQVFYRIPGFAEFTTNADALRVFQSITAALLLCVTVGWRTRYTLPLAAVAATVMGGILRQYCHFFHTLSVPLLLLYVLAFGPCSEVLSIDARRGTTTTTGGATMARGAWFHFTALCVIAFTYVAAGASKLQNGGLMWWSGLNLKGYILADSIGNQHFDSGLGLRFAELPPASFAPLGLLALGGELAFGLVPFSIWARRIVPIVVLGMHVGIFLLQNVLFFDLMVLLSVIFIWPTARELTAWLRDRARSGASAPVHEPSGSGRETGLLQFGVGLLLAILVLVGASRLEFYPLSAFQMYSWRNESSTIHYDRVLAVYRSGKSERARLERGAWALADGRWSDNLGMAFEPQRQSVFLEYLRAITPVLNADRLHDPIVRYVVERWEWDFEREPLAFPNPGRLLERVALDPHLD